MSMAVAKPPVFNEPVQHFVFRAVPYDQFVAITDAWGERSGLRVSYDGARLEIMTTSLMHERWKSLLGHLVRLLTLELGIPLESGGQTTFRSPLVERGIEPDSCFWIRASDDILGVDDWVAGDHPPPDLVIEIVVTRGIVSRTDIYAKFGVPEIWVFDGANLKSLHLQPDGSYREADDSLAFPFLTLESLRPFLMADATTGENTILKRFLDWLRSQEFTGDFQS